MKMTQLSNIVPQIAPTTIVLSVSGGETSNYMAWWCLNNKEVVAHKLGISDPNSIEFLAVFSNTGLEHTKTYEFQRQCDETFGLNTVWIEPYFVKEYGVGVQYRIVDFDSAMRIKDWRDPLHPFHSFAAKKECGVPNKSFPGCSERMKKNAIIKYLKDVHRLREKKDYWTAIGLRTDETKRISKDQHKRGLIYPLTDWHPVSRNQVKEWFSDKRPQLTIPFALGNCVTCWQKSAKNLEQAWRYDDEAKEAFAFINFIEQTYGAIGPEMRKPDMRPRVSFRGRLSASELIASFDMKGRQKAA